MTELVNYFKIQGFSEIETTEIATSFELQEMKRGDYFLKEGETDSYFGFVTKGSHQYFETHDGEEKTTFVALKNSFIGSIESFITNVPSKISIRVLTPSIVYKISKADFMALSAKNDKIKTLYYNFIEYQMLCLEKSRHDLLTLTPQQRYVKLLEEQPEIFQEVPLHLLASILAITPRHLSRIRKQIITLDQ